MLCGVNWEMDVCSISQATTEYDVAISMALYRKRFLFYMLKASCDVKFLSSNFKLTNFKLATVESEVPNY